jgi:NADH-quinone oxidoreductase chain G
MTETKNNILRVYIDGVSVYVEPGTTVFQACEKLGIELPRFCYHELLNISGNCRICIVEIEKIPKPQVACSFPVIDNIKIHTNSPVAIKAREGIIEFLLLNHPLDCPICDQAGECDLQNHYITHGPSQGRFFNTKRSVSDKNFGLLVKTVINRCIHCTRCVRFATDVAGVRNLGVIKRGIDIEISTFFTESFNSEVSANVIDLCPVGALTDKLQIFKYRPWETFKYKAIDISDNLGSHIIVETKNNLPVKVTPRPCKTINEEWITDKARVSYVGFRLNRLAEYSYLIENNYWEINFEKIADIVDLFINIRKRGEIIFGRTTDSLNLCYGIYFCKKYGWEFNCENSHYSYPFQSNLFQSTITLPSISQIESCFIIGINPRAESSLVNLRLNRQNIAQNLRVFYLGCASNLQYKAKQLGLNFSNFFKAINGISIYSQQFFKNSIIIYGDTLSRRIDSHSGLVLNIFSQYLKKSLSINILQISIGANTTGLSSLYLVFS